MYIYLYIQTHIFAVNGLRKIIQVSNEKKRKQFTYNLWKILSRWASGSLTEFHS